MSIVVDKRIALKVVRRGKPTVSSGRKAAVLDALWRALRTPPGSKSGACIHRGSSGTWESHVSPCHIPGMGDRVTKSPGVDRKSTRLNSSHVRISYAVFCLKKKKKTEKSIK